MSLWSQLMFQDANSPVMENMIMFHDHAMLIIMMIITMIIYMISFMVYNKFINHNLLEGQMIEIIWTIIPMILLIFLAIPSLKILYLTDEINLPNITVKIMGHQWYWSYEYNDFKMINFDSFMIKDNNMFRLLDVDNRMVLPYNTQIRMLVNSTDVIHSFTIPSMGVKVDAVPGRINQISSLIKRPGVFFGQCSEICGVNHSFMPIVLESTSMNMFINWIKNK
uniref:Cytochrome c oxidase subunit 2 n=3 Tax=Nasonia TaxID=7424 RepID=B5T312_9HYME|nr:cytochrome c oxidase subunit II [Nasonia giraulti]ACH81757.1 cytochrome oxidase subunit 2 [Nasonia giraulti]UVN15262.1 cytochrome oxidase subunit 2 [Nasonia giraulti]